MPLTTYIDELFPAYSPEGTILPFRQPVAAMPPAPALSGSAVNQSGNIVSFLPPMEDWLTGAGQVPVAQATGGHSCQNGGSCTCGGKCKGSSTASLPPTRSQAADLVWTFVGELGTSELRASMIGLSRIRLSVDMPGNSEPVEAMLTLDPQAGWRYDTTGLTPYTDAVVIPPPIPRSATLSDIALGFWAGIFAQHQLLTTLQRSRTNVGSNMTVHEAAIGSSPLNGDCTPSGMDMSPAQDMKCTFIGNTVTLNYTCGNTVVLNIRDCCITHDIDCWCGPPFNSGPGDPAFIAWDTVISGKLAGCIAGKILSSIGDAHIPGYCGGVVTAAIEAAAWAAVIFAVIFTAVFLAIAALAATDSDSVPIDGRHKKSCLCGGTVPTFASQGEGMGPCYDLCKARGMAQNESCYNCSYYCVYDASGTPTKKYDDGSDPTKNPNGWPCCPGTLKCCLPDPSQNPCPKCAQCGWYCDCDKKTGKWYESYDVFFPGSDKDVRDTGVPCCNGQDWHNPPPDPHYNCAQFDGFPCT